VASKVEFLLHVLEIAESSKLLRTYTDKKNRSLINFLKVDENATYGKPFFSVYEHPTTLSKTFFQQ
jgi:hypothetical protein